MKIVNLGNKDRWVYLFIREDDGSLKIKVDKNYYPFFYVPTDDSTGKYHGYHNNLPYKKQICQSPWDIRKIAPKGSLGKDIPYLKQYLIQRCPKLTKTKIKYAFYDIEVLTDGSENLEKMTKPISCISVYDNFSEKIETFYLGNYRGNARKRERELLRDFSDYIKELRLDLFLSWNNFDWAYLNGRYSNIAKHISPVGLDRWGFDGRYPVGISILDYMEMFKKFTLNKRESYALDNILEEEFGKGKDYKEVDFSKLNDDLFLRNREDVKGMSKIENKYNIIDYFDEIRLITKTFWEDLPSRIIKKDNNWIEVSNNSKIIESLALQKMNSQKLIAPNKNHQKEREDFDGAFRKTYKKGRFTNLSKFDLDSAYPRMMQDFCLDSNNFVNSKLTNTVEIKLKDRKTDKHTKTYYIKQDSNAITCQLAKDLLNLKQSIKKELGSTIPDTDKHKNLSVKYAAIKSVVNSYYGSYSLPSFVISDNRVSECTTFLVRDLLEYCIDRVRKAGHDIIFVDTDSIVTTAPMEMEKELNEWIQEWAEEYGISTTSNWNCEGYYSKLVVTGKCRYIGDLVTPQGIEREIKGIEVKRRDASQATKEIQAEIFERILDGATSKDIRQYIKEQEVEIKKRPLKEVGFPFKIKNKEYKSEPVYVRAYRNTKLFKNFDLKLGYVGHYAYITPLGYDENKKPIDVLAYRDYCPIVEDRIDWDKMMERNITNKYKVICEAMDWDHIRTNQLTFKE